MSFLGMLTSDGPTGSYQLKTAYHASQSMRHSHVGRAAPNRNNCTKFYSVKVLSWITPRYVGIAQGFRGRTDAA